MSTIKRNPCSRSTGLRTLADEAAGVLDLLIATPSDLKGVIRRATAPEPDPDAVRLGVGLLSIAKKIATAEADDQPRCGSCERELRTLVCSIVIVQPHTDSPATGMTLGICTRCASTRAEVLVKARAALRRVCFPDLRPIDIHPTAGRA